MPAGTAFAAPVFAFGLVAFGFLGMGPVTIAVDSFGPVSDNAQSVYELSQIESVPNVKAEIKGQFGFDPDFENGKDYLEEADGAGNTFKATAKPVLIGTAVVGATTMVFSIVILLDKMFRRRRGETLAHPARDHPRPAHGRGRHILVHGRCHSGRRNRAPTGPSSISRTTSSSTPRQPPSRTARRSSRSAPSMHRRA